MGGGGGLFKYRFWNPLPPHSSGGILSKVIIAGFLCVSDRDWLCFIILLCTSLEFVLLLNRPLSDQLFNLLCVHSFLVLKDNIRIIFFLDLNNILFSILE